MFEISTVSITTTDRERLDTVKYSLDSSFDNTRASSKMFKVVDTAQSAVPSAFIFWTTIFVILSYPNT